MAQGVAKLAGSQGTIAQFTPLGALKQWSLSASPGWYAATKALIWGGAMFDGVLKYMGAAWAAQSVAAVGAYQRSEVDPGAVDAAPGWELGTPFPRMPHAA